MKLTDFKRSTIKLGETLYIPVTVEILGGGRVMVKDLLGKNHWIPYEILKKIVVDKKKISVPK